MEGYCFHYSEAEVFSPISPANGIKNTEPAPKYDPCRLLKKGDIVEPVERWGRKLRIKAGQYRIEKDEVDNRVIMTHCETGFSYAAIDAVYLNIVTPVEELEPYKCGEGIDAQLIFFQDERFAEFENEEDAQRVCAWLNSEYRKEKSNV